MTFLVTYLSPNGGKLHTCDVPKKYEHLSDGKIDQMVRPFLVETTQRKIIDSSPSRIP